MASAQPELQRGQRSARAAEEACRVTIVAHDIGPVGGMERVLSELIAGLAARGHEVTVVARTCELPPGTVASFKRVRGPARPFLIAYPWFLLAGSLALRRARRGIVQVTGGIVLARADVVSVHYCHQVGPSSPSRSSAAFRLNTRLVRVVKRLCERLCFAIDRSATFVCVSQGVAEEVRAHYHALDGEVITIHNGVDTVRFAPGAHRAQAARLRAELDIPAGRYVAAFVGGEWERKGLRPAIEALAAAREWMLIVAGEGDQRRYRELAQSLGVGDAVRWLGVSRDVAPVYAIADAFVMPTAYETFSLATFEAAASGLPVLATAVSGIRELLREGVNGFYISPEPQTIAARLRQLAGDEELRARIGACARESALAFGWKRTVESHHELYQRLAAQRARARSAAGS